MALKYYIDYKDIVNIDHRVELYDDDFVGTATEVNGYATLDYLSVTNPLEVIKGSALRVTLEAGTSLTFSDLFSEEQRTIKVIYKRDSVVKFQGWLNPEGWFENWVDSNWLIEFDCLDGLGYLKDLAYVENATGLNFVGKKTQLETIANCLRRTGIDQNINVDIDVVYTGLSTSSDVLANTYIVSERFIKDDNDTIMSCEEVLKSVLQPYAACVTSRNGEWFVYKPNQLAGSSSMTFFRYDSDGAALTPATATTDISQSIGSEVNGFYPHHASGNQSITLKNSLGGFRISYKYGLAQGLNTNYNLEISAGPSIDEWTINSSGGITTDGVGTNGVYLITEDQGADVKLLTADAITTPAGVPINFTLKGTASEDFNDVGHFIWLAKLDVSGTVYYLDNTNNWVTSITINKVRIHPTSPIYQNITTAPTPDSGDFIVEIYAPEEFDPENAETPSGNVYFYEYKVNVAESNIDLSIKGEFHTFQRTTKPSTVVKDVTEVTTGDNIADVFLGTMYKADQTTPTSTWNRIGVSESYPILGIMGYETMRMSQSPAHVFTGDVFGYFDNLSTIAIDSITGIFLPIEYRYNTVDNLINCKFIRIFNSELADVEYNITLDRGEVVKPTIKG